MKVVEINCDKPVRILQDKVMEELETLGEVLHQEADKIAIAIDGEFLLDYFSCDSDIYPKVKTGEIQTAVLEFDVYNKTLQYSLYESKENIQQQWGNANTFHPDDFDCTLGWILDGLY